MQLQKFPTANIYNYRLEGQITPKARPRFNRGQTYLPQKYRQWKESAIVQLLSQRQNHKNLLILKKAEVEILLLGRHRGNSDLDNLAGSVLDALVGAEILIDDNLKVVSRLAIAHQPTADKTGVEIKLFPL